ncbi:MAG: translation elongation factor Ts [Phycisphaerales bacterium]|nr:translation elongation factor Ts [Phycisphaerales bacterium]
MSTITAATVKALREKTGLPMMDCKKALEEANGDEGRAIEIMKEKGQLRKAKMADREAGEGRVAIWTDPARKIGAIIELRCETAPVAQTDDFEKLATTLAQYVAENEGATVETLPTLPRKDKPGAKVSDLVDEVFNRLRENIQISRFERFSGDLGKYVHFDGRTGAIVELSGPCPDELSNGVCMHIVAMNPPIRAREDADPAEVARERATLEADVKGKPPEIAAKIVDGKLGRWFSEFVLLEQPYVKDDKKSISQALDEASKGLTIKRFRRFQVGGA